MVTAGHLGNKTAPQTHGTLPITPGLNMSIPGSLQSKQLLRGLGAVSVGMAG